MKLSWMKSLDFRLVLLASQIDLVKMPNQKETMTGKSRSLKGKTESRWKPECTANTILKRSLEGHTLSLSGNIHEMNKKNTSFINIHLINLLIPISLWSDNL